MHYPIRPYASRSIAYCDGCERLVEPPHDCSDR